LKRRFDLKEEECKVCAGRRYQDGSDDSTVSFQSPTKISKQQAYAKVRAHEAEHVSNNIRDAKRDGKKVVAQTVSVHTAICPACGEVYVSGGKTRSITKNDNRDEYLKQLQEQDLPDLSLTNSLKDTILPVIKSGEHSFAFNNNNNSKKN
jgi:hypothetical protein